jgi:hypothetical protein
MTTIAISVLLNEINWQEVLMTYNVRPVLQNQKYLLLLFQICWNNFVICILKCRHIVNEVCFSEFLKKLSI